MGRKAGRYIGISMMLLLFLISSGRQVKAQTAADMDGAKKAIITAYQNYQKRVDVSAYHLYNNRDTDALTEVMTEVVNETPYLFYAGQRFAKLVSPGSNQIRSIELEYGSSFTTGNGKVDTQKIASTKKKIKAKVKKVLKVVTPKMTKLEKAMVLHDYLIQNTAYCDDDDKDYRLSEWGVFLKGKANCQGYSLAYGILLRQVGIPVKYVTSDEMMHMWTIVKLNGKWYHVDVTWDDPLDPIQKRDQDGLVMHDMFLCSTAKMKSKGYYGFSAPKANSKKYDNKYWNKITSAFFYRNGKWLYQTDRAIVQRNALASGKTKKLYRAGGRSFIKMNQNKYYFINYNRIYLYDRKKNQIKLVFNGASKYKNKYTITQLKYVSGKLTYRMYRNSSYKSVTKKVKKNGLLKKK